RTLSERRAGNGQGIDRIGLATGALALARGAHQLRGDTNHPLAGGNQEALEGARDVAAVLDRPDALLLTSSPPCEQLAKARLSCRGGQLAGKLAGSRKYRAAGVGCLVGVRSDHDHLLCPLDWLSPVGRTAGGQTSLGAKPRSYQVTAAILGRRRATQRMKVRPPGRQPA